WSLFRIHRNGLQYEFRGDEALPSALGWPPTSFRKAFDIVGDDDLRRVGFAYVLQIFQATSQLGSRPAQAAFKRRFGRLASFFVRELLKYHGWEQPPFRPVVCRGRTD